MQKAIPLKDVETALICAIVRLKSRADDGNRHGRTAAMTQAPFWLPTCRDRLRERRLGNRSGFMPVRQHFTVMHAGDLDRLLERSRMHHGLPEVRRTWGAGMRALQAEFNAGAMR